MPEISSLRLCSRSLQWLYAPPTDLSTAPTTSGCPITVALAEITQNYNKKFNFRANTYLEATIIKGLTFRTELSADYNNNKYYYYMPDYRFGIKTSDTRTSRWTATNTKYWSWRNIFTYANTFGRHAINAMVGQEMSHNHYETQVVSATDSHPTVPRTHRRAATTTLLRWDIRTTTRCSRISDAHTTAMTTAIWPHSPYAATVQAISPTATDGAGSHQQPWLGA